MADAGLLMSDMISAIAVGRVDDKIVADLNYDEEAFECDAGVTDIPVAIIPSTGEVSLLQMDGITTKKQLFEALELAKDVSKKLYEVQKSALKKKYKVSEA